MATEGCPKATGLWLDRRTGERRPTRCRRLSCPYCGPRLALSTANAIAMAAPQSSAVMTTWGPEAPSEPQDLFRLFVAAVNLVGERLRSEGAGWEYVWTLELSDTGIPNAHVLQWGSHVEPARFRAAAIEAGMRWGDVQPIRHLAHIARYILKLPLASLDLGLDGGECMDLHLALNGGRLVHASRGFWRDVEGCPLPGVRAARVAARRRAARGPRPSPEDLVNWRREWRLPLDRLSLSDRPR